ncbi:2-oxo-4-hydroxy-4-carboxy-5-ureidoimidazoline decarboxylase [Diaphorobacter ruginosibacter]|jgi:2-oxo-4-hydroxy-4-carboxy-5-ureidoimidazoline decarboxylase|uniref:2-oxo-4-hydroxy-4-carboxy-5-ureidoimidazoline decarboxylase n=1 Tax=Diaphorobacter ruginosibacter TaxID=1715720 RepID=A0A7G9RLX9_9BURK|nr:2-oxo-4-hydroxy-4-carboxy-5-ureidoimidazoline decarboxylase [Diaphorobacter ruginosibacter]MDR2335807.1 2-oxo-4-hydroxy-4-carboxy-5-ureidoimidazoline decarboxylase [Burkholderiaceae bacterium]QNN56604.1 2-oxo-4-hydroxy-4-carboxy-5-ureidoimidazoline decarboxylase [Diaphorobacter ruginosibacter]
MTTNTISSVPTLDELNAMTPAAFVEALGEVFEYAPWVAESAAAQRPFASIDALHAAMIGAVHASPREQAVRFLCGHPELSANAVRSGTLTADSQQEQQGAGFGEMAQEQGERLAALNQTYRTRHGFPFIACVRHYTRVGIFAELASRTERGTEQEFSEALRQIGFISRLRLSQRVRG